MAWSRIPHQLSSCDVDPQGCAAASFKWVKTYEGEAREIEGVRVIATKKFILYRCENHAPAALCQLGECEHGACVVDRGYGHRGA